MAIDNINYLVPPPQWDHKPTKTVIERVLSREEVQSICWGKIQQFGTTGASAPQAAATFYGCTQSNATTCYIVRVDDERIKRHENAHCNGWVHP